MTAHRTNRGRVGAAARTSRAAALDAFLAGLFPAGDGIALVAVGGLGRRECAPHGDLDLVLLHDDGFDGGCDDGFDVAEVAAGLWYPVWDAGYRLDHSVRTVAGALSVAGHDPKVALGLLDARHVAGDGILTATLARAAADQWRRTAADVLSRLREETAARHRAHGELAFLLAGDVKEAAGGLRDIGVLRGIGRTGIADSLRPAVRAAHTRLLDLRDALHLCTGRCTDRLLAQEIGALAALLGLPDRGALRRQVSSDARTVAHALDDAWRAVARWRSRRSRPPVRRPVARDVIEDDGEVVLARAAIGPRPDPALSLRVAAAAAGAGLSISRATCEWLATHCPPLPVPWPVPAREALLALLGAGDALVPTWETCDRYGLVAGWLPEWNRLRSAPQHHPVHRFTLDRHLVQAAAEAAAYAREVDRPDLLVLGAFLHDVGKGLPGDHSEAGVPVAAAIGRRIGLPPADVAVLETLVRRHLLLPEVATTRDLSDPVTIASVAAHVGDAGTLRLLHALARADAAATGPAAWSEWKGRLVADLVSRVAAVLSGDPVPPPPRPDPALVAGSLPAVRVDGVTDRGTDGGQVSVAAADRRGLLAAVAGCLAVHRLEVVSADVATVAGRALVRLAVQPRFGSWPEAALLAADLRRVASGDSSLLRRLRHAGRPAAGPAPAVMWHRDAATDAVILELRARDTPGLLFRVATALDAGGADVRAARVSTLGADVVDAFYLAGSWPDRAQCEAVAAAVLAAAASDHPTATPRAPTRT
jgi:[protein-PII] uridylyltransferase